MEIIIFYGCAGGLSAAGWKAEPQTNFLKGKPVKHNY